jgi:hypothetical protein
MQQTAARWMNVWTNVWMNTMATKIGRRLQQFDTPLLVPLPAPVAASKVKVGGRGAVVVSLLRGLDVALLK